MGLLENKTILVTGLISTSSIAFHIARTALDEGATVLLSAFGRALPIARSAAELLPSEAPVLEIDITNEEHLDGLEAEVRRHTDGLDGVVHSIAYAPASALGGAFLSTPWADVATATHVSAYSLQALTRACLPMLRPGSSIVGLDYDASVAWPGYDWMGVAKSALESIARYLAMYLGEREVRVNLVAAGLVHTLAASSIPNVARLEQMWTSRPPLAWDVRDPTPVARACAVLLSDWLAATTGEILHVDGGLHAVVA